MHSKTSQLVSVLTTETQNNNLQWKEGPKKFEYTLQSKSNKIIVGIEQVSVLGEIEPCERVYMTITDLMDNEIDQIGAIKTENQGWEISTDYDELKDLHEGARRSAKGIDKIIDNLLDELDSSPF